MVSQYERQAWANLGPSLGQAFQNWGQQRARRSEFDAQMAMAELQRRDAKEARDEGLAIDRERLELDETRIKAEQARLDDDAEWEASKRDLNLRAERALVGMSLGKFDPKAAGDIAGKELAGGIQQAEGVLPKIGAAIKGIGPALKKGATDAPRESYADLADFLKESNIPADVAGRIITMSGGVEALKPEDINYNQMKSAFDMSIVYGLDLPAEFQAMPGVMDAITKGKVAYAKAQTDADKMSAIELATAEAHLIVAQWRAEHPGGVRSSAPAAPTSNVFDIINDADEKPAGEYTEEELKNIAGG